MFMPEIAGSDGIRSRVTMFSDRLVSGERCEAMLSVAIVVHVFSSMMKSIAEYGVKAEIRALVMVVRVLMAIRFWLGDS
jgi:hypothetical protein